jgi:hypothetical protein
MATDLFFLSNAVPLDQPQDCLNLHCPERFDNAKIMINHLKTCTHAERGEYRCPCCRECRCFPAASRSQCQWDRRESISQKVETRIRRFTDSICRRHPSKSSGSQSEHSGKVVPLAEAEDLPVPGSQHSPMHQSLPWPETQSDYPPSSFELRRQAPPLHYRMPLHEAQGDVPATTSELPPQGMTAELPGLVRVPNGEEEDNASKDHAYFFVNTIERTIGTVKDISNYQLRSAPESSVIVPGPQPGWHFDGDISRDPQAAAFAPLGDSPTPHQWHGISVVSLMPSTPGDGNGSGDHWLSPFPQLTTSPQSNQPIFDRVLTSSPSPMDDMYEADPGSPDHQEMRPKDSWLPINRQSRLFCEISQAHEGTPPPLFTADPPVNIHEMSLHSPTSHTLRSAMGPTGSRQSSWTSDSTFVGSTSSIYELGVSSVADYKQFDGSETYAELPAAPTLDIGTLQQKRKRSSLPKDSCGHFFCHEPSCNYRSNANSDPTRRKDN